MTRPDPTLFDSFDAADICGRKSRRAPRSAEANADATPRKPSQTRRIVEHLRERGPAGATCEELSLALGIRYTTCSARCAEIRECGWVAVAGQRATTAGSAADVLVLIREGEHAG